MNEKGRKLGVILPFVVLSACSALWAAESPKSSTALRAGVAVIEITPEKGTTHDPLLAKAMVFRQGDRRAALVVCDQAVVSGEMTSQARKMAFQKTGIPVSCISIAATHTHTGRSARKDVADRVVQAIVKAQAAARRVKLQAGTAQQKKKISFNRRYLMKDGTVRFNPGFLNPDIVRPVGPIDPAVGIVLIRDAADGGPLASLANFSLHLDTVGKYTEFSADYPCFLEESLKEQFGDEFVSVFGTGPCGDVNHFDVSRPRVGWTRNRGQTMLSSYVPKSTTAPPSPLTTEYIGKALAATVKAEIPDLKDVKAPSLDVRSEIIRAPLATYSEMDLAWAKEAVQGRMSFLMGVRARRILSLEGLRRKYGEAMPVEVQVFRLGADTAIVTLPGEIFVELGLAIKKDSPFTNTLVIELANANETRYVPTRKAFCEGDYEVVNSRLEAGGGEMMVDAAVRMLKELKARAP